MNSILKKLVKDIGDEYTSIASDGESSAEFSGYVDTGSYIINAVISGSLFGGIADNKVTSFAGESATGKTFFVLGIVKNFLDTYKDGCVIYYDTEAAITKKMMEDRGIDPSRVIIGEPETIQQFRNQCLKAIESYSSIPVEERPRLMIVLDSLGMLSSTKELADASEGKETKDLTKPALIKGAFRTIRLKLARIQVPMLVTQHVYASIGSMFPSNEVAGGSGLKYSSDTIAMLSKRKEKDGTEVVGNVVHVKMFKSRLSRENQVVDTRIMYDGGLDRYYGLLELSEKVGLVKKVSTRYEFPGGIKAFGKEVRENPEKFWTRDMLEALEPHVYRLFRYTMDPADPLEIVSTPELLIEES